VAQKVGKTKGMDSGFDLPYFWQLVPKIETGICHALKGKKKYVNNKK